MHRSGIEPPLLRRLLSVLAVCALAAGCAGPDRRPPNIVLVVVDTLRADHLGAYGYLRDTSPEIDRQLAAAGVTFERAYSQATWTLPSTASLLTGLEPGRLLDDEGNPWGIPEGAATLAEALAERGYSTAAFIANPTMHEGNGYRQGFGRFYTAPFELASFERHGDEIADRVLRWLEAGAAEPFFLYVHLLDPHDPYENEDVRDGRSPFDPGYAGRLRGTDVHALYLGARELEDPEADLRHLTALYDTEIRFVDRQVGRILQALPPDALLVFTSDHGEELHDRGAYKHGETLYDEMIRVPLLMRWEGRLEAGRRIDTTVRLLDLYPTLLAAAGGIPDPELPGIDLLPALTGNAALPERPAFSRHLSMGPERAAVVYRGRKLVLFDRHEAFEPVDDREAFLWQRDVDRLSRRELYDLTEDPAERSRLEDPATTEEEALLRYLDQGWPPGLRLVITGLEPGSQLRAWLEIEPTEAARPLFFADGDEWRQQEGRIELSATGDGLPRVVLVPGFEGSVSRLDFELDGNPWYPGSSELPAPPIAFRQLERTGPPPRTEALSVRLWFRSKQWRLPGQGRDEETERRLRALGYLE